MPETAPKGYSLLQVVLHWTIAALVTTQLVFNDDVEEAFDDRMDGDPVETMSGALVHVSIGVTILVLAVVRLAVRLKRGTPPVHDDKPAIINWLGYATHFLLYGFIFAMPLTGALAWFGGIEISAEVHEFGRFVLIPLIGLHILGGLAEHFVFRNDTLMRMLRPQRS
jgi:cytochrome b561